MNSEPIFFLRFSNTGYLARGRHTVILRKFSPINYADLKGGGLYQKKDVLSGVPDLNSTLFSTSFGGLEK
jgi:hypothetical protein